MLQEAAPIEGLASRSENLSVGIVALSAIADDPRVRRQGDAFAAAGWGTVAIGLPGALSVKPAWKILDDLEPPPVHEVRAVIGEVRQVLPPPPKVVLPETVLGRLAFVAGSPQHLYFAIRRRVSDTWKRTGLSLPRPVRAARRMSRAAVRGSGLPILVREVRRRLGQVRYVVRLQSPRLAASQGERVFWTLNSRFGDLYRVASDVRPDVWLANDWTALPIARRLAREQNALLVYDTHELAADEYTERLKWRLLHRPTVVTIERTCLRDAALVTCVSDGIADRLQELYGLPERPMVIRNTPTYQAMPFRPTADTIRVLYHGIVSVGRGLESCIRAVPMLRAEFELTIRGPSSDEYRASLQALIAELGVGDRVHLVPPVPMTELVRAANAFDIGIFALPDHSLHNRYALPNKFFEYMMAGLALCLSDLPEMARLVSRYDLGRLFAGLEPATIAAALNAFDPKTVDYHKRCALEAAKELNWEVESERLVNRCVELLRAKGNVT